jgi:hypothetical protein
VVKLVLNLHVFWRSFDDYVAVPGFWGRLYFGHRVPISSEPDTRPGGDLCCPWLVVYRFLAERILLTLHRPICCSPPAAQALSSGVQMNGAVRRQGLAQAGDPALKYGSGRLRQQIFR